MSLADRLVSYLRCPGCSSQRWDLRADGVDDLPRLEGTLCCSNCGQAFAARGGVLDMIPSFVEDRLAAIRLRLESPPVARLYEETLRHVFTPIASPLRAADRRRWLLDHQPAGPTRTIVDFGCGRGGDLELMRRESEPEMAVGVDVSQVLLAEAARTARRRGRRNVAFLRADLDELSLSGAAFDWACCYGVLHRLRHPASTLETIASQLAPGGQLTALTTNRLASGLFMRGQQLLGAVGRVQLFDRPSLEAMLARAGLELQSFEPYGPVTLIAARRPAE